MTEDVTGFRRVLHEWAARQLARKSIHVGPFQIIGVDMEYTSGSSISDSETWVNIRFRHDGRDCPEKDYYIRNGLGDRCLTRSWFMSDTKQTVDMLNELLSIADEK